MTRDLTNLSDEEYIKAMSGPVIRKISVVSGGFDPLHSGHIMMFREAAKFGDLIVIVNSDEWLTKKKGKPFLPWTERATVIGNLGMVDKVVQGLDRDGTVSQNLKEIRRRNPEAEITFCNGGDRTDDNTPELKQCEKSDIKTAFNVGGGKIVSSSMLLDDWVSHELHKRPFLIGKGTQTPWGGERVIVNDPHVGYRIKMLEIKPSHRLSLQRHKRRDEYMVAVDGPVRLELDGKESVLGSATIKRGQWHRLSNTTDKPVQIIEVQLGDCDDFDIERKADDYGRV